MTEERKHAILFAATLLCAKRLMPALEQDAAEDLQREHYVWRAIEQASRILERIDKKWPTTVVAPVEAGK